MGRLLSALGQYGEALKALQRGLFHAQEETAADLAKQTLLPLKLAIASAYLEKGDFEQADNYLSLLKEPCDSSQHLEYQIRWLELSGKLHLLWGNLGAGLKRFQQVQEKCQQMQLHRAVLRSNLNLAHILILFNQTSTAQQYLADTQNNALQIDDKALVARAELLLQLASARSRSLVTASPAGMSVVDMRKQKRYQQTVEKLWQSPDLSTQSSNYLAWFEDRALAFQWYLSNFQLKNASDLLQHIKRVFKSTDSQLIQIQIQILSGISSYYQGTESNDLTKINQAHQILAEICPQLEEMSLKPELWQVQRILIWCRTRLNYPLPEIETLTTATNQLLEQMTSSLTPEDQVFYLLNKWTADEEYIAAQITQLQRLQVRLRNSNFLHEIVSAWKKKDFLQLRLSSSNFLLRPWLHLQLMRKLNALVEHIDRYKDVLAKRTIKGDSPQETLRVPPASLLLRILTHPKNRVTLSFLILPDRVLVVKTSRFLFDFEVIPTTRVAVRNVVQRWYQNIERMNGVRRDMNLVSNHDYQQQMTSATAVGQKITDNLADILQLPKILDRIPKHIEALTIVPDDILHGFPFASVMYKGEYLIKRYALAIAYESKSKPIKPKRSIPLKKQALVIGISNGNKKFNPLPGVRRELPHINKWLDSHQIKYLQLVNNDAHKAAIIETISKATLLHIACHGTFEPNQPDSSGLVLISDSGEQEILSVRELSEIDLTKLRHATLSSCWSADHFILPRRWIISLPETLWRSGTESILGCLWEIDDKVAVSFMAKFYNYLNNYPRDQALRRTQLDCLGNRLPNCRDETDNPLFWAGFNLYGDYHPLMRIPTSVSNWYLIEPEFDITETLKHQS
jgi:CHAT domain-containing protein